MCMRVEQTKFSKRRNAKHTHTHIRTHPSMEYMEEAQGIVSRDPSVTRNIFFSTDNQTVLDEIERGAFDRYNFTFYYTR